MSRWPHDDPASLAAFYGDPAKDEPGKLLVPVIPPFQMYYAGKPVKQILFHRKAAGALRAALEDIWTSCGRNQARVDALRISHYSGAYNHRLIRGSADRWSNHAYGAAIDFDAEHNGFNTGHGTMSQIVIDAFKRQGALWGGDYHGRTDPMHFEFCSREAAVARPVALVGEVQADGDSDAPEGAEEDQGPPGSPPGPAPSANGFFSRARNWVVAAGSSIGFGGLGALTDWQIAAALFAFIFLSAVCLVTFIICFFGAEPVRVWVRKHVA
ncbi:M15 family metallopeptidase [Bradyrhizobium sp. 76]|uniref:M15 family metallopeptidase n=1 Tax=Bradyrhizobium sp. 76 TaxID=2782680 RepID=UPI001FFB436A|nr:M15 family metallopeptidase [Bradyrhizobium sp. 76]MCK1407671.1 M15 family metallopeptidase [Bradyrhizobium sp. 76]